MHFVTIIVMNSNMLKIPQTKTHNTPQTLFDCKNAHCFQTLPLLYISKLIECTVPYVQTRRTFFLVNNDETYVLICEKKYGHYKNNERTCIWGVSFLCLPQSLKCFFKSPVWLMSILIVVSSCPFTTATYFLFLFVFNPIVDCFQFYRLVNVYHESESTNKSSGFVKILVISLSSFDLKIIQKKNRIGDISISGIATTTQHTMC